jgi:hypothetical protein
MLRRCKTLKLPSPAYQNFNEGSERTWRGSSRSVDAKQNVELMQVDKQSQGEATTGQLDD